MRRRLLLGLAVALAVSAAPLAAQDEPVSPLTGTWNWQWKDAEGVNHKHVLEVSGAGKALAARERFDDLPAVKVDDLKLDGKEVRFSVTRDEKRSEYQGKMTKDDTISGVVTVAVKGQTTQFGWTANKDRATEKVSPKPKPSPKAGPQG